MAEFEVDLLVDAMSENTRERFRQLSEQKQERQRREQEEWREMMVQRWNNFSWYEKFNYSSSVPLLICLLWIIAFGFLGCDKASRTNDVHIDQYYVMIPLFASIPILAIMRGISKWVFPTIVFWSVYAIGALIYTIFVPSNDCASFPVTLMYTTILFLFNVFVFPYEMSRTMML